MSSFKISARTILQLGAELISSDSIAFYELVKNAVDATAREENSKNKDIVIDIVTRLSHGFCNTVQKELAAKLKDTNNKENVKKIVDQFKEQISSRISKEDYLAKELSDLLEKANSIQELLNVIDEANYIQIVDKGEGMSLEDLNNIYLTIGTNFRYKQKKKGVEVLGEKGIGRLSAMRLGEKLYIETTKKGERNWNNLEIDWRDFSHDSEDLLEDIEITPKLGKDKENSELSGTSIRISALNSYWDSAKAEELVNNQFSRFTDPFKDIQEEFNKYFNHTIPNFSYDNTPLNIKTYYNNKLNLIPSFENDVLKYAHAAVWAELKYDSQNTLSKEENCFLEGEIYYRFRNERKKFRLNYIELCTLAKIDAPHLRSSLSSLGQFKMIAFWFNRGLLLESEGVPNASEVKKIVKKWAGGLMLFRDGFRIFPYGEPNSDDWLNIDEKGLASQGFKVNRRQVIGKVDITSNENPKLIDQTNRQGLRDNDEKLVLIQILKHILDGQLRPYLTGVDNILRYKELNINDFDRRIKESVESIKHNTDNLVNRLPDEDYVKTFVNNLNESISQIQKTFDETKKLAESYQEGKEVSIHLAGVGLMTEFISHELYLATNNALNKIRNFPSDLKKQFESLEEQLKTIQKRLSVLDPTSVTGRQQKETFDLADWIRNIFETHKSQFERHNVQYSIQISPANAKWKIRAVKGMIVQVFENLISNSVYWFKQLEKIQQTRLNDMYNNIIRDETFKPNIQVIVDVESSLVKFTDNGIGIPPERKDDIFLPYVTTKPPHEGKGLGLFISREIASYHDARIYLSDKHTIHPDRLNTFIFEFKEGDK